MLLLPRASASACEWNDLRLVVQPLGWLLKSTAIMAKTKMAHNTSEHHHDTIAMQEKTTAARLFDAHILA